MREVKKNSFTQKHALLYPSSLFLFHFSYRSLYSFFILFPLSSTHNSRGNRARISRTHSYVRASRTDVRVSRMHPRGSHSTHFAHGRFIDDDDSCEFRMKHATTKERPFYRIVSTLLFLVENIARPPVLLPAFSPFFSSPTKTKSRGETYLRSASPRLHFGLTGPLFPVK